MQPNGLGMFIHWGPVSLKGTEISWSRANYKVQQIGPNADYYAPEQRIGEFDDHFFESYV